MNHVGLSVNSPGSIRQSVSLSYHLSALFMRGPLDLVCASEGTRQDQDSGNSACMFCMLESVSPAEMASSGGERRLDQSQFAINTSPLTSVDDAFVF